MVLKKQIEIRNNLPLHQIFRIDPFIEQSQDFKEEILHIAGFDRMHEGFPNLGVEEPLLSPGETLVNGLLN